jgi:hypothetical protein
MLLDGMDERKDGLEQEQLKSCWFLPLVQHQLMLQLQEKNTLSTPFSIWTTFDKSPPLGEHAFCCQRPLKLSDFASLEINRASPNRLAAYLRPENPESQTYSSAKS